MNLFMIIYRGLKHYNSVSSNCLGIMVISFFLSAMTISMWIKTLYDYDRSILYLCAAILFILVLALVVSYKIGCKRVVRVVNLMRKYKNQLSVVFVIIGTLSPFSAILLAMLLRH